MYKLHMFVELRRVSSSRPRNAQSKSGHRKLAQNAHVAKPPWITYVWSTHAQGSWRAVGNVVRKVAIATYAKSWSKCALLLRAWCLHLCWHVCASICKYAYIYVCMWVGLCRYTYVSEHLRIYVFIYLCIWLSTYLYGDLSLDPSVYLSIYLPIDLSIYRSMHRCIWTTM